MIELDYAFLADYATIQEGKLTTVGASFTRLVASSFPLVALFGVAGRIRCDEPDVQVIPVSVRVTAPGEEGMVIEAQSELDASVERFAPYDGKRRGIVFAVQLSIPLLVPGLYRVEIDLDGTDGIDRILKFEALDGAE